MSPKNKKKLDFIRIKLDKLDNKLLSLIKSRSMLVKEVLKLKQECDKLELREPNDIKGGW